MASTKLTNTNLIETNDQFVIEGNCTFNDTDGKPGKLSYSDIYSFNNEKLQRISSYCIEIKNKQ